MMVVPMLMLVPLLAGCPKRAATTVASAPAPTGPVAVTPAPAPSAPAASARPATPVTPATPAPAPGTRPSPSEYSSVAALKDVHFDFDKYEVRSADTRVLDANAAWLKSRAGALLLIEGHCDERGTADYNVALGERRAQATMNYLVGQGVQANRIAIISYGEERPGCTAHGEGCWSSNRRAHFLVKER
jgi:peptidoglycan-associated lipoprotein